MAFISGVPLALQFDHIGLGGLSEVFIFVEGLVVAWFLAGACRNPSESGTKLKLRETR